MTINTQKLREALSQIEDALNDAYQSAGQGCCGHGYGECCGNPEPVWDAADQKIMYVLGPVQRALSDAVSQADAQAAEITRLKAAQTWQPIETAPKDGSTVLLRGRGDHRIADGCWLQAAHGGLGAWVWSYVHSEPHHWMPLPAGPDALQEKFND